jgi:hypothetical protein
MASMCYDGRMPKFEVFEDVKCESTSSNTYKWSVRIRSRIGDTESLLVAAEGLCQGERAATSKAERFTRWAVRAYNLFGLFPENEEDDD